MEFASNLTWHDTLGTQQYADYLMVSKDNNTKDFLENKYPAICRMADEILLSLEHDGTEYGKALSIAKWVADNVNYVEGTRTVYKAIIERKAVM